MGRDRTRVGGSTDALSSYLTHYHLGLCLYFSALLTHYHLGLCFYFSALIHLSFVDSATVMDQRLRKLHLMDGRYGVPFASRPQSRAESDSMPAQVLHRPYVKYSGERWEDERPRLQVRSTPFTDIRFENKNISTQCC